VKTVEGLVQSCRMTMGLNNASAYFQRLVNNVYDGVKGKSLQAYLDDLAGFRDGQTTRGGRLGHAGENKEGELAFEVREMHVRAAGGGVTRA
jgi:hypothetical protein